MKKVIMFSTALLLSLSLMGCNFNRDKGNTDKVDNNATQNGNVGDNNTNQGVGDTNNNGNETNLEVAKDAADRVAELDEVDSATVLVTNRNAYVAVVMNDGANTNTNAGTDINANTSTDTNTDNNTNANTNTANEDRLSKDLEDKIADKVREADNNIDNVYVSLNPDFVERMNDYRTRIDEGRPVAGFFDEFNEAVRNVFPDAH